MTDVNDYISRVQRRSPHPSSQLRDMISASCFCLCGLYNLPDGANVCYEALVGDARDDYCTDQGYNLQFQLVRREGFPAPGGTSVNATCQLSQSKAVDCPDLQ